MDFDEILSIFEVPRHNENAQSDFEVCLLLCNVFLALEKLNW
jgi:hypothetical protein